LIFELNALAHTMVDAKRGSCIYFESLLQQAYSFIRCFQEASLRVVGLKVRYLISPPIILPRDDLKHLLIQRMTLFSIKGDLNWIKIPC
jgi:hypothetical protein